MTGHLFGLAARLAAGVVVLGALQFAPASMLPAAVAADSFCTPSAAAPSPITTVYLFRKHHRSVVHLRVGDLLRVVVNDRKDALGAPYPRVSGHKPPAVCEVSRSGTKHRKVVVFEADHSGAGSISASPRVGPGLGAATESVTFKVS